MSFWTRLLFTVICWFLTMLVLIVVAAEYVPHAPAELGPKVLYALLVGACMIVVVAVTLWTWMWVWMRKYR